MPFTSSHVLYGITESMRLIDVHSTYRLAIFNPLNIQDKASTQKSGLLTIVLYEPWELLFLGKGVY